MTSTKACPVCGSQASAYQNYDTLCAFYVCPVCGRYEITVSGVEILENPKLSSFLFYNRFVSNAGTGIIDYRYHTTLGKEKCDEYKKEFENGDTSHGRPVHMDSTIIENWYPKTFAERIDFILLYLAKRSAHIGQRVTLSLEELYGLLFIERKEKNGFSRELEWRQDLVCKDEADYLLDYLVSESYITTNANPDSIPSPVNILLTPKAYSRIDSLQKAASRGSHALVAMKFGEETKTLREAIRKGIQDAGYNAIFIDEVQHNDFITPELLKYIKDSKFVVVDLTHQNNGAYFEEGFAMGLGKPVIQLCKRHVQLHFDIAQKNTIMWDAEEDIPERLTNRIKATID